MKKCSIIPLLSLFVSISAWAAICPAVQNVDPLHPPAGWSTLLPPYDDTTDTYYFGSAIHSFNGSFYFKQVICEYETCPSFGCYKFEIISNDPFEMPNSNAAPWNHRPVIAYTLLCTPPDHNPSVCEFA